MAINLLLLHWRLCFCLRIDLCPCRRFIIIFPLLLLRCVKPQQQSRKLRLNLVRRNQQSNRLHRARLTLLAVTVLSQGLLHIKGPHSVKTPARAAHLLLLFHDVRPHVRSNVRVRVVRRRHRDQRRVGALPIAVVLLQVRLPAGVACRRAQLPALQLPRPRLELTQQAGALRQ